ncbi:MAG: YjhX family toxin [Paracoccaceae bacterium]
MNISKVEQRVLHVLAQGGAIHFEQLPNGKVREVACLNRNNLVLADCTLAVFGRLKKRRFNKSVSGGPYRVIRLVITSVRPQFNNR